jgi:NitT/TauT family transport system permease protein
VLLTPPSAVLRAALVLASSAEVRADLAATLSAYLASLVLGGLLGAFLGAAMGASRATDRLLDPYFTALNAVPKIALMPLVVLWLGLGFKPALFLGTVMAAFPIAVSVRAGMRVLERDLVLLARAFGAGPRVLWLSIIAPGLVPHFLSAWRVAANYALVGVLIVEFFAADRGLGYRMVAFSANFQTALFLALLLLSMALALAVSGLLGLLEERASSWRPEALK